MSPQRHTRGDVQFDHGDVLRPRQIVAAGGEGEKEDEEAKQQEEKIERTGQIERTQVSTNDDREHAVETRAAQRADQYIAVLATIERLLSIRIARTTLR